MTRGTKNSNIIGILLKIGILLEYYWNIDQTIDWNMIGIVNMEDWNIGIGIYWNCELE